MIYANARFSRDKTVQTLCRFLAVGALGTLIDLLFFTGLRAVGLPTLVANTLSYSAGIVNNFGWHRRWAFAQRAPKAAGAQFSQFVLISLSALMLNNLIVLWLTPIFNVWFASAYGALIAKLSATGIGLVWNFFANTVWTFPQSHYERSFK